MTGYVLKRSETDYVIDCDSQGQGGYNVVPREIDKWNRYSLEEVRNYIYDNPDMLLDSGRIEKERMAVEARIQRDSFLQNTVDRLNPLRWELLSEEQKQSWRDYRQALLDVPQQPGFPKEIDWPVAPERTGGENE